MHIMCQSTFIKLYNIVYKIITSNVLSLSDSTWDKGVYQLYIDQREKTLKFSICLLYYNKPIIYNKLIYYI